MCLFSRLFLYTFSVFFCLSALLVSCEEERVTVSEEERKTLDSIIRAAPDIDSLTVLKHQMKQNGNQLGYVIALRETGKRLRNESRFDEALKVHSEGLKLAEDIVDTLEMVQALNNIGTIYRRLGVLNTATDYHYRAWKMSEECTDTTFVGKKNRVVSLNGLGNIYMTLGNYERADSVLRMALEGEKVLKSPIGQAINYANLGSIFIQQNNLDSAWVCYRHSMRLNQAAKNTLGISLCHTYFGLLYEKTRRFDEYNQAFELMRPRKTSGTPWERCFRWPAYTSIWAIMQPLSDTCGRLKKQQRKSNLPNIWHKSTTCTTKFTSVRATFRKLCLVTNRPQCCKIALSTSKR